MTRTILRLRPIVFPDLTRPRGFLSPDMRSQACWYFYTLAQKMRETVGLSLEDQRFRLLDDDLWMETRYEQLARSVALMYGLESPDEFAKAWDEVRDEARACKLPAPHDTYTRLVPRVIVQ